MYPKEIEKKIINRFSTYEFNRFLREAKPKTVIEPDSQHHSVAKFLNEIVKLYGGNPQSYEYKALLTGLTDKNNLEYVKRFCHTSLAKKFNISQETSEILRLIAWIKIVFNESTSYRCFGNNRREFEEKLINDNFEKLHGVLKLLKDNQETNQNNLFKASFMAKVTSTMEDFNKYCNEVEIISCILENRIGDSVFCHITELKDKVILHIAPKYEYYPACSINQCYKQLSFEDLHRATFCEELNNENNIQVLANIINYKIEQHGTGPYNILLENFRLVNENVKALIKKIQSPFLSNTLAIPEKTALKLVQQIFKNGDYSENSLHLINRLIFPRQLPLLYEEIINNIHKMNTIDILQKLTSNNQRNISGRIIHLLACNTANLSSTIKFLIIPSFYFNGYGPEEGKILLNNVWLKLPQDIKTATMLQFIHNSLGNRDFSIPLISDVKNIIKSNVCRHTDTLNNYTLNNCQSLIFDVSEHSCADEYFKNFMIEKIISDIDFVIPDLLGMLPIDATSLQIKTNRDRILIQSDQSFIDMLKIIGTRHQSLTTLKTDEVQEAERIAR